MDKDMDSRAGAPPFVKVKFTTYAESVPEALDACGAREIIASRSKVIIKPNLTQDSPPPITTPVECVEELISYCRKHSRAKIIVAEGSGGCDTSKAFDTLGYREMAQKLSIELVDLNEDTPVLVKQPDAIHWKELYLPATVLDGLLISVPVLKDHTMAVTTVSMKNLFGLLPPKYYKGAWNKAKLHSPSVHVSTFDLCLHRKPDICLVDAVNAAIGSHLGGKARKLGFIIAGTDCVAVDAAASELLGHRWQDIKYLKLADGKLGNAEK